MKQGRFIVKEREQRMASTVDSFEFPRFTFPGSMEIVFIYF